MVFDPQGYLGAVSSIPDVEIDLVKAALALANHAKPGASLDRCINHFRKTSEETKKRHADLLEAGAPDDAGTQLAALKHVISVNHGYAGDTETFNDLQNANLIRVIDRRKGLPVALAIIYIAVGRTLEWDVGGLDFPGHFLCRIEKSGLRYIFDPFNGCKTLEAHEMRDMLKKAMGRNAELSANYFMPVSNREILMRLQNHIKYRQIEGEDYPAALQTVKGMRLLDPNEYRLLLDAGVLYARTGNSKEAIAVLEEYIGKAPKDRDRHDAAILLHDLKNAPL